MRLIAALCLGLLGVTPALAQERETLGVGRVFTNDYFGDNRDRWRTGAYTISILRGQGWDGRAPDRPGAILEYRLRTEIIAPERLNGPGSDDRAYVGAVSAGLHTHFTRGRADISAGVDLVALGPQTGLSDLQDWFHEVVDAPNVSNAVIANQAGNSVHLTGLAELSYPVRLSERTQLRPFVEAQYGVENVLRVGADVLIGPGMSDDLWLRDPTSGQLFSGIEGDRAGIGYLLGADYALVGDSAYFPASFGTEAEDTRFRLRAGVHTQLGERISFFYGATYLSEEYVGQPEGQVVGSLKLNFNF